MATDWANTNAVMKINRKFIDIAESLTPTLAEHREMPVQIYNLKEQELIPVHQYEEYGWGKGDILILDYGHNGVGYLSIECGRQGSPQDAPAFLSLRFCEVEKEIYRNPAMYDGWISKGWIQEEWVHIDHLPDCLNIKRRYAFRYVRIEVIDTSQKFQIMFSNAFRTRVSAVDMKNVPLAGKNEFDRKIDEISLRTLENCMQKVFEDGPKRDRRLWLGDLWLQAKVNYVTFHHNDMVKRCLYLFGGMPNEQGQLAACVFTEPSPLMDDTFLLDYSLLFLSVLLDYYMETHDEKTMRDLMPIALHQLEIVQIYLNEESIICEEGEYHCFIDWNDKLNKQCAMQAVYLFSLRQASKLCECIGNKQEALKYWQQYLDIKKKSVDFFWDKDNHVFCSGRERQISWASQVWMILAGVVTGEEALLLLDRIQKCKIRMVTPYMNHMYTEALFVCGGKEKAFMHIREYWGGMAKLQTDTFWELFDPENPTWSPYGSDIINSYCHAWSCTPAYFFRKEVL